MSIPTDRAAYRVLSTEGFFGPNDHLYKEGECILYDDEPNEQLEPLNEPAFTKMQAFLERLDELGRAAAAKHNRTYAGRPRSIDGALAVARMDEQYRLTVRGVVKNGETIEAMEPEAIPETGSINPKKRGKQSHKGVTLV